MFLFLLLSLIACEKEEAAAADNSKNMSLDGEEAGFIEQVAQTTVSSENELYPPEGWTLDLLGAIAESEKTGKDILLNFTGSDWCVWCEKLRDEVFSTDKFQSYAEENLILVFLDFPQGIDQSQEIQSRNQVMASLFGVQGFPTLWLLDSELVPVLQTGYQEGGPDAFIQTIENGRVSLSDEDRQEVKTIVRDGILNNIGSWE